MARAKVYHKRGGAELIVADGGTVTIESGGTLTAAAGSTISGLTGQTTFASDAEAITGTDTSKVLCPKNLAAAATTHVAAASATVAGKVELATDAESIAVTDAQRAVTPHGLGAALAKLFVISFTGRNLAGACTATGVAVGDVIFGVAGLTDMGQADSKFEGVVTVENQIQQSAAENLSAKNFMALVYRPA
jgi:hypothetical protein